MKTDLNLRKVAWAVGQILFLMVLAMAAWLVLSSTLATGFFRILLLCCIGFLAAADIVILFLKQ